MNNSTDQRDAPSRNPAGNPVFLDRALLSPASLAALILFAVVLSVLAGWKIINIEAERAQILADRAVLKREQDMLQENLNLYNDILKQLPALRQKKEETEADLARRQGEKKALAVKLEALQADLRDSQLSLQKAQDDLQTTRQERDQLEKEAEGLANQKDLLSRDIAILQGRGKTARSETEAVETRLVTLQSQVDGLEKRRKQLDTDIGALSGPGAPLAQISERLKSTVKELQDLGSDADKAADNLAGASKKAAEQMDAIGLSAQAITKTAITIEGSFNRLDSAARGLEGSQQSLEQHISAITKASEDLAGSVTKTLTPAADSLASARKELNTASTDVATSAGSLAEVGKQAKGQALELAEGVKAFKDAGYRSASAVDALLATQQEFDRLTAELATTAAGAGSTATALAGEQKRLKDSVDALAKAVLSLQEKLNSDNNASANQSTGENKPYQPRQE